GDLGNGVRSDEGAFNDMISRAEQVGFSSKVIGDLKEMGGRKRINDVVTLIRDFLTGKAAGPSIFATAMDYADAPKTYEKIRGNSVVSDVEGIAKGVSETGSQWKATFNDMKATMLRGLEALRTGKIRY
ncbi:hypothetical protein QT327_28050, partial [Olivibacter sp. 47]|uniref:hypothetical protein n=1 Tax=Olivibacter sp. 47 TaxID=3056486 RepID=UPI0025A49869